MNDKALQYSFDLFRRDGYTGTIDEYKDLIATNQKAMDHSFNLFSTDGYNGSKDDFSALIMPGKESPIAPGAAVEVDVAPQPSDTESTLDQDFLESQKRNIRLFEEGRDLSMGILDSPFKGKDNGKYVGEPGFWDSVFQGIQQGKLTNESYDETLRIFYKPTDATIEDAEAYMQAMQDIQNGVGIEKMNLWSAAYDKYVEEGDSQLVAGIKATKDHGAGAFGGVMAQSVTNMFSEEALASSAAGAVAGGATGAGVGAAIGSIVPGAGTAAGAYLGLKRGLVYGALFGNTGFVGTMANFQENLSEYFEENNLEFTTENLYDLLQNEEEVIKLRNKSLKGGLSMAAVETMFVGLGAGASGKVYKGVKGATKGIGAGTSTFLASTAKGGTAIFTEGIGGASAQATSDIVQGKTPMTKDLIVEFGVGTIGAPTTLGVSAIKGIRASGKGNYVLNNQNVSYNVAKKTVDEADAELLAGMDLKITKDKEFQSYYEQRYKDEILKTQIDTRVTDPQDRADLFELEKELQSFKNLNTESARIRASEIKQEISEISNKYKRVGRRTAESSALENKKNRIQDLINETDVFDREFNRNLMAVQKAANQKGFSDIEVFENTQDYINKIAETFSVTPQKAKSIAGGTDGVFLGQGRIFIDRNRAKETGAVSVASHEFLHPVLNAMVGGVEAQANIVNDFKNIITKKQLAYVENKLSKYTPEEYNTEFLNVFSDGIMKGDITYNKNLFQKIGEFLQKLFRGKGFDNISFDDARGVYNFLKEYNTSIKTTGKISDPAMAAITGDVANVGTANQVQASRSNVDGLLKKYNTTRNMVNRTLIPTDMSDYTTSEFGGEIAPVVESITKRLFDKIPPEATKVINDNRSEARKEYKNALITEAATIVSNEYKAESLGEGQTIDNFISNRLNLRANDLAKRLGVQETILKSLDAVTDEGGPAIQIESAYTDAATIVSMREAEKERLVKLIDPTELMGDELAQDYYGAVTTQLEQMSIEEIDALTFKSLKDLAPQITARFFGIPESKAIKAAANLATAEIKPIQDIIYKNRTTLISLLPEGAVLEGEAVSDKLIGTGLGLPRKLQEAFYDQRGRLTKGAGLPPFILKENITQKDFLKAFGINTDGTVQSFGGKDPRAQSILALVRLTGQLMTNTVTRAAVEMSTETQANIRGGLSDLQFKKSQTAIEQQNGLTEVDDANRTRQFANQIVGNLIRIANKYGVPLEKGAPILLANTSKGPQKFFIDRVNEFKNVQEEFIASLPAVAKKYKGLINNIAALIYREDSTGYDFLNNLYKTLVNEDGSLVTDRKKIEDLVKRNTAAAREEKKLYSEPKNLDRYKNSKKYIDDVIRLMEGAKENKTLVGNETSPNNATKIRIAKEALMGNEKEVKKLAKKSKSSIEETPKNVLAYLTRHNDLNAALARMYISLMRDFVNSHPNKVEAVKSLIIMLTSNRNTVNAFRSLSTVKRVVYSEKKGTRYHFEHDKSMALVVVDILNQVLSDGDIIWDSPASLIPVDVANARDNKNKIGKEIDFLNILAEVKKNNPDLKEVNFNQEGEITVQASRSITFLEKIKESEAAYNKIKKSDKYDMVEVVSRQMFPESANQTLGSYRSLTPEQRFLVFNEMQKNGMVDIDAQFSLAQDISDKISNKSSIDSRVEISEKKANLLGKNKGKWRFFIPPSADDFAGLMYYMVGKGKKGDEDLAWFKQNLFDPFAKGINNFTAYRQNTLRTFNDLKKVLRGKNIKLKQKNSTGFSNEVAVRVYIWNTRGLKIPGLTENEINTLTSIVSEDPNLLNFASQIMNLTNFAETPNPEMSWDAGTLTTDILDYLNTSSREKFLAEYLANSEEIFGKFGKSGGIEGDTANRLRAAFGDNYVEALSDVLYRMKTGRRRITGNNKLTNQFVNWINDSVGAIMFFNTRSALLQQLSFVNFINFSDNNPLAAARAFTNQKQFWGDYATLFNSDFLKARRSGLKTDVNADEIARAAEEGRNPIRSVIASLLKKGFLPTQLADSHAIAIGGASFFRNRIKRYQKEGLTEQEARAKAFIDFQEVAEESQQSSRPDRISMQQASGLGRIILAFANTPMQYARLTKKAALDLINRRGDWKTNLSKLMYYGAVQNIIFSSLQSALFALAFDEDEDEEKVRSRYYRVANSSADGLLRGLGFGGAAVATTKNMILEAIEQAKSKRADYTQVAYRALSLSPPIDSKIRKLASAGRTFTYRNTREKMRTEGFSLDNPIFESVGKIVSATTNLPADRVIRKLDNLTTPVRQDVENWQAISLALGYSKWDVGLIESQAKKPKTSTIGLKKYKRKKNKR